MSGRRGMWVSVAAVRKEGVSEANGCEVRGRLAGKGDAVVDCQ